MRENAQMTLRNWKRQAEMFCKKKLLLTATPPNYIYICWDFMFSQFEMANALYLPSVDSQHKLYGTDPHLQLFKFWQLFWKTYSILRVGFVIQARCVEVRNDVQHMQTKLVAKLFWNIILPTVFCHYHFLQPIDNKHCAFSSHILDTSTVETFNCNCVQWLAFFSSFALQTYYILAALLATIRWITNQQYCSSKWNFIWTPLLVLILN